MDRMRQVRELAKEILLRRKATGKEIEDLLSAREKELIEETYLKQDEYSLLRYFITIEREQISIEENNIGNFHTREMIKIKIWFFKLTTLTLTLGGVAALLGYIFSDLKAFRGILDVVTNVINILFK